MTSNNNGETRDVQSTMFGPLWGRANYSRSYPDILDDPQSLRVVKELADYDFSRFEHAWTEYNGIAFLVRARTFDDAITKYTKTLPKAAIVNLGCGLDTTFSRVDNGKLRWFDLDLPDGIELRKKYIPETKRSKCIPSDVFDARTWFDKLDHDPKKGMFFFAGGLFLYFPKKKVAALLDNMSDKFPGAEMLFDLPSTYGVKFINKRLAKADHPAPNWVLGIDDPQKEIPKWSKKGNIKVLESFNFWDRIPPNDYHWELKTRFKRFLSTRKKMVRFVHARFE